MIERAEAYAHRPAILSPQGAFTYGDLLDASARVAAALLDGREDLSEARVAFLVPSGFEYAAVQWAVWRAGGIAVPLCVLHPRPELEYVIEGSGADTLLAVPEFEEVLRPIAEGRGLRLVTTRQALAAVPGRLPRVDPERRALILYTSGTTSKPKGVVTTHANIEAQVTSLVQAWEWTAEDHVLHVLPLHHIHGIINVLSCALWSGARCTMLPKFDAGEVWTRLIEDDLTLFMAVPTIYVRLIAAWEAAPAERRRAMSEACRKLRLMVSGSAALPVPVLERWREISGHTLLERYGMTEIGMGLSNPLHGPRLPGHVGTPLPGVEVRVVDESGRDAPPGTPGEIRVRGGTVFLDYWNRPEATREAFRDGWFRTGDVAVVEQGSYRILGRESVDIIKTGGYKVSALEIEEVLLAHPRIAECAVVGVEDPEWGERVCAALVLKDDPEEGLPAKHTKGSKPAWSSRQQERPGGGVALSLEELREWARERLAPYKIPSRLRVVETLPRNAMGKVVKADVVRLFGEA